jgi:hypothetical protein
MKGKSLEPSLSLWSELYRLDYVSLNMTKSSLPITSTLRDLELERIHESTVVQVPNCFDSVDLELHIYKLNLGIYLQSSPQLSFNNMGADKA